MNDPLSQLNALINSHQGEDEVIPDASQPGFRISLNPQNLELWRLEYRQIAGKEANLLLACLSSTGPLEDTSLGWVVGAAIRHASVNNQDDCRMLLQALGLNSGLINSVLLNCPGIAGKVAWALYLERHGHLVATPVLNHEQDSSNITLQATTSTDDMKRPSPE
ncbi:MAG: hypothetical protein NTV57_05730 [Cyanobacteria bacterium]|nr:hypothetical protein [Cyanobacteriota bacterium]